MRGIFILSCLLAGAFAGCGREEPPVVEAEPGARKGLQLAVVARCGPRPPREDRIDLVVTADGRALLEEEVVPWSELAARLAAIPTPRDRGLGRAPQSSTAQDDVDELEVGDGPKATDNNAEGEGAFFGGGDGMDKLLRAVDLALFRKPARIAEQAGARTQLDDGTRAVDLAIYADARVPFARVQQAIEAAALAWISRIHYIVRTGDARFGALSIFLPVDRCGGRRVDLAAGEVSSFTVEAMHEAVEGRAMSLAEVAPSGAVPTYLALTLRPRADSPWQSVATVLPHLLVPQVLELSFGAPMHEAGKEGASPRDAPTQVRWLIAELRRPLVFGPLAVGQETRYFGRRNNPQIGHEPEIEEPEEDDPFEEDDR